MKGILSTLFCGAVLMTLAAPAMSHDCRVRDAYLRGAYEGDCDDRTEMAQGKGEAKGADTYVGEFVKGRPDGKGVYTWENGARLDGSFKQGKAHGPGVYVSAKGARYEGQFDNGKLEGLKTTDCPSTPGPLAC
jgi:MORN repeat